MRKRACAYAIADYEVAPDLSISIDGLTSAIAADSTASGLVTGRM